MIVCLHCSCILQTLLPKGCCRIIYYSSKYEDSWKCNFLGLKPNTVVPSHIKDYVVLDIKSPDSMTSSSGDYTLPPPSGTTNEFAPFSFVISTPAPMPEKGKKTYHPGLPLHQETTIEFVVGSFCVLVHNVLVSCALFAHVAPSAPFGLL